MKIPAFRAGYLFAVLATAFVVIQPIVVHAQISSFLLGDIEVIKEIAAEEEEKNAHSEVLGATSEESDITEAIPAEPEPVFVEVVKGDTLSKIATSHNTTYKRLFDANEFIVDPNIINPGDKIRIPFEDEELTERALPAPKPIAAPARTTTTHSSSAAAPVVADGSVWDALARCESGGNWAINTGNGYYGGLQFNAGTWLSNGGGQYAQYAHQATREQQIDIAQRLHAARGFQPWPACSRKLGLL